MSRFRAAVMPLAWLWLASAIIGAGLYFAAPARADRATDFATRHAADICISLDKRPTLEGLTAVMGRVEATGLSARDAGAAVTLAVLNVCPAHVDLLERFVALYAPDRTAL